MMFHTETQPIRMQIHSLLYRPISRTVMNVGIMPPLKNMVKANRKEISRLKGKLRDSAKAAPIVTTRLITVPDRVYTMEFR